MCRMAKLFFLMLGVFLFSFVPILAGEPDSDLNLGLSKETKLVAGDFRVNNDTKKGFNKSLPDIAQDASGNFVITWRDSSNGNYDIYAQRYDSSGTPLGPNFRVNDDTVTADHYSPAIAMDASGNFVITWRDFRSGSWNIYAQKFHSSGTRLGSNFKVNDDTGPASQGPPVIAMDGLGNFVITWHNYHDTSKRDDIYAQRYNSSGTALGSNFKVNDDTGTPSQGPPVIATDGSGNFVITWHDFRNGNWRIYTQKFNSSSTPSDPNFMVNDDTGTADQSFPAIAMDSSSDLLITWQDFRNDNLDIYAQKFNSSGTPSGSNFKVNDDTGTANHQYPAISTDKSGKFVIVWQDYRNGNWDIYAQRYDSSGKPDSINYLVTDPGFAPYIQRDPAVATNGSKICFTWLDSRAGNLDIYAKVVDWGWTGEKNKE